MISRAALEIGIFLEGFFGLFAYFFLKGRLKATRVEVDTLKRDIDALAEIIGTERAKARLNKTQMEEKL